MHAQFPSRQRVKELRRIYFHTNLIKTRSRLTMSPAVARLSVARLGFDQIIFTYATDGIHSLCECKSKYNNAKIMHL